MNARFAFRDERGLRASINRHQPRSYHVPTRQEIADRTRKMIVEHLDPDPDKVTDGAALTEDLGADSIDHIELIMAVEEEFDIQITDAEAEEVKTVGQAIELIAAKLKVPA